MEYLIKCTEEQKQILQVALYGYLNRYRERLEESQNSAYKEKIEERIKIAEKMIDEISS